MFDDGISNKCGEDNEEGKIIIKVGDNVHVEVGVNKNIQQGKRSGDGYTQQDDPGSEFDDRRWGGKPQLQTRGQKKQDRSRKVGAEDDKPDLGSTHHIRRSGQDAYEKDER